MYSLLIIILLTTILCLLVNSYKQEGYQNNRPSQDTPDDTQFYACHDHSTTSNLGNNNYKLKKHGIGAPQQGPYSYFLDTYKIRNYDEIFHAPICESKYNFSHISNLSAPEIIDHEDLLKEDKLLKIEETYDENAIKDPYYLYGNPNYIGNKLIYSKEINGLFLSNHRSNDSEHMLHRLDKDIDVGQN